MIGEKKSEIFKLLNSEHYPKTILIDDDIRPQIFECAQEIGFPLIAKPDIGERGKGVELIKTEKELRAYSSRTRVDFLLQEYIDLPFELGVFFIRHPTEKEGRITSIVAKEFLTITGDGEKTVSGLIQNSMRGSLQVDLSNERFDEIRYRILGTNEKLTLEPIGNHCRGTKFLDARSNVTNELTRAFNLLSKNIDGFYYGRYDLKCSSYAELEQLKNFKIVELNGVGAEPAHIYNPGFSLWKAYQTVFKHFSEMAAIARANKKSGISYWSHRQGIKKLFDIRAYNRCLTHT